MALDVLRKSMGHFKMFKVIMYPTAQVRNLIGNAVLMDLQGASLLRVDRPIRSARGILDVMNTGQMSENMARAERAGLSLFQDTFSKTELQQFTEQVMREPVTRKNWKGGLA